MSVAEIAPRGEEFERTPPHDLAAEQCVLGGMLLSKDAISDVIEVIRPQDHYRPAHQVIHEVVLDLYGRGEPADAITVANELTRRGEIGRVGGAPYLHTLIASVPTAANAGYYARIVRERAILRRLVEAGTRIVQFGYAGDAEADDLVDRAQAEVYAITDHRVTEDYHSLADIMPGALDEIEAIGSRDGGMTGVPTGFADLDALTNGLHPGQMVVIAARPAVGKALALDTPLPTPTGWTTMGDVQVGDQLIGADGKPARVVAATDTMHGRPCYEVAFDDGRGYRRRRKPPVADVDTPGATIRRTAEGYRKSSSIRAAGGCATPIPADLRCPGAEGRQPCGTMTAPLGLPESDLPIAPVRSWRMAWLTGSSGARFVADPEVAEHVAASGALSSRNDLICRMASHRACTDPRVCCMRNPSAETRVRTCGRSCGGKARFSTPPVPAPKCARCDGPATGLRPGTGLCRRCWKRVRHYASGTPLGWSSGQQAHSGCIFAGVGHAAASLARGAS